MHAGFGKQAAAEEVTLGYADFTHGAVGGRIAARDREIAGGFLLEIHDENHAVARRTGLGGDFHALEEIQVLQPALGTIDQRPVVGIAFRNIELAPDHIVPGAGIAAHIDALDIGSRAFRDGKYDRNRMFLEVAVATRADDRKRVTAPRCLDLHFLDGLFQRFGVVKRSDVDARETAQRIGIERRNDRFEIDRSDTILLTFFDLEGDEEALGVRIVLGQRGDHLDVGEAVLEVIAAN